MDDRTLEVDIDREDGLNQLYAQLSGAGIRIQSMRNKTNLLELLFINLIRRNYNESVQL